MLQGEKYLPGIFREILPKSLGAKIKFESREIIDIGSRNP